MEGGRRRSNHRRSQSRKPPRGSWQPTVPAWEKEFCRVVGSMDWDTLMQMKKYVHLYDNVIEWNDSAGEEAFINAKRRYWADKNSLSCDISLPDPDLYIDEINWDSDIESELLSDVESKPVSPKTVEDRDPVVIFGDFTMPNQDSAPTGWGDDDENFVVPHTHSNVDPWAQSSNKWATPAWPGYSNDGWQGYTNDAWQYNSGGEHGYMLWEGDWNNWNLNYADNYNHIGPDVRDMSPWDDDNHITTVRYGGRASNFTTTRDRADEQWRKRSGTREWNSNSLSVGQTWDNE